MLPPAATLIRDPILNGVEPPSTRSTTSAASSAAVSRLERCRRGRHGRDAGHGRADSCSTGAWTRSSGRRRRPIAVSTLAASSPTVWWRARRPPGAEARRLSRPSTSSSAPFRATRCRRGDRPDSPTARATPSVVIAYVDDVFGRPLSVAVSDALAGRRSGRGRLDPVRQHEADRSRRPRRQRPTW